MKHIGIITLICFLLCGFHSLLNAEPQCPDGKWFNPEVGKCVTPGDGATDVDREFQRELRKECQFPCGDGWCCPNEYACKHCQKESGNSKRNCYKNRECWKK